MPLAYIRRHAGNQSADSIQISPALQVRETGAIHRCSSTGEWHATTFLRLFKRKAVEQTLRDTRAWLVTGVTDMRRGFDDLAAIVQPALDVVPLGGLQQSGVSTAPEPGRQEHAAGPRCNGRAELNPNQPFICTFVPSQPA